MSRIFISYRRDDSAAQAGRLFDRLSTHFGSDQVFMDVDSIELGEDFEAVIENEIGKCDAFIAVIGKQWLTVTSADGKRRLDNPHDFVRLEVEAALKRSIRVIPVLVDDATMPKIEDLPPSLARLTRYNALEISNQDFNYYVGKLTGTLDEILHSAPEAQGEPAKQRPPEDHVIASTRRRDESSSRRQSKRWQHPAVIVPFATIIVIAMIGAGLLVRPNQIATPTPLAPTRSIAATTPTTALAIIPTNTPLPCTVVTTLNDNGTGSLRDAIICASPGGTITFKVSGTISLSNGQLPTIKSGLTIDGTGQKIVIDGSNKDRVFCVLPSGTLSLQNLTVSGGKAGPSPCINTSAWGGAIYSSSSGGLTINTCAFENNSAEAGGAVFSDGTATILNSTFSDNQAFGDGGAIDNSSSGHMTIINSTFANNTASSGAGGGILTDGYLILTSSTLSNNHSSTNNYGNGGGLSKNPNGIQILRGNIVWNNLPTDISGNVNSLGFNLIGSTSPSSSGYIAGTDQLKITPLLNPLALNTPGMTKTMSLQVNSPAIGKGGTGCPTTDQRGVPRKVPCDIGAYETTQ